MSRIRRVAVITLFPEMFSAITDSGITRRAFNDNLLQIEFFNPRSFTTDKHQTVDDRPYGGGPGMVMRVEPLEAALIAAKAWVEETPRVIYLSPQGQKLDQTAVESLSHIRDLILVCGRYEGIDERFIEAHIDEEWSIGDYVLSGGELPAMVMLDALIRRIPGALGDADSAEQDSFVEGLLDCPHYTRPEEVNGVSVPEVLLSGDHGKIAKWRKHQSLIRTAQRRPDLLAKVKLSAEQQASIAAVLNQVED
ncbi:tRNA (guanine-N(1)-)-methyltransferase [Thalassocella blandensis]|nr:tRNA (guanine-N(1)-)-methyltransferase [Thalassocella blandensis]